MRSIKLFNALLFVWVTFFTTMGNNNPVNLISNSESKTFILDANNFAEKEINLEIIDQEELVLLSHTLDTRVQEAIKINMVNLPDGIYTIVVEDELRTIKNKVIIKNNLLMVDAEYKDIRFKPVFHQTEEYVDLSWLNLGGEYAEIKIVNSQDDPVHSETVEFEANIQRRYDISRLEKGEYIFKIKSKGVLIAKAMTFK